MLLGVRYRSRVLFCAAALFLAQVCLIGPVPVVAQEDSTHPEKTENKQSKKDFPGINEIVPRMTLVAARIAETDDMLHKVEALDNVYKALAPLVVRIDELEALYTNWEEIKNWRLSRLRNAQSSYAELGEQQKEKLNIFFTQLQKLEKLRSNWEKEKIYWREWQTVLIKSDTRFPEEMFQRTLANIENVMERINQVGGELVRAQQKYSPGQEIITRRLGMVDKALSSIRRDTFRRNTFSIFEPAFYRQFNRELYVDFISSLTTTLRWPKTYLKDRKLFFVLQGIIILLITQMLISRRKKSNSIAKQWSFLFQRPLAGAIFINIIVIGNFTELYRNLPPSIKWVLMTIITVVVIRLINALLVDPREKKVVKILSVAYIITETLQTFGIPEPFLQLYNLLLCAAAIFLYSQVLSRRHEEKPLNRFLVYVFLGISVACLATSMLGFERLASMLLIAFSSTFFFLIVLGITLRLVSGGIESFMHLQWVRNRTFMQVLGLEEATRKLQTLSRVIILINAALSLMVVWRLSDSYQDGRETILSYELAIGELTLTVNMVLLVIIILYLTLIISWMIQAFVDSQIMTPKDMDRGIKESLKRLIHYGLFTFGFLVAVSMAGLDLQKFTILAGALGVGIGFGLQNIVNNFVSGLILLFERPVKVGDIININQDWGTITRIGLRSTVFETFDNSEVIVPNADLIAQKVTNWTFSSKIVRIVLPVGVEYGSPLEKVLEILNKAAKEHPEVLSNPEPNSIFEGFGNSSIDFQLRFWVKSIDDRLRVRTEVAVIVDRLFREEKIVIAFPQQDLHLRSIENDLQALFSKNSSKTGNVTEGTSD